MTTDESIELREQLQRAIANGDGLTEDQLLAQARDLIAAHNPDLVIEFDREAHGRNDPTSVRRNCAFCGRERSRKDDNHAPGCSYWYFFGGRP